MFQSLAIGYQASYPTSNAQQMFTAGETAQVNTREIMILHQVRLCSCSSFKALWQWQLLVLATRVHRPSEIFLILSSKIHLCQLFCEEPSRCQVHWIQHTWDTVPLVEVAQALDFSNMICYKRFEFTALVSHVVPNVL